MNYQKGARSLKLSSNLIVLYLTIHNLMLYIYVVTFGEYIRYKSRNDGKISKEFL